MSLSLLMVSKGEPHAWPFIVKLQQAALRIPHCEVVVCADGPEAVRALGNHSFAVYELPQSRGFIEDRLDLAVNFCTRRNVLRVDDDETLSPALVDWLASDAYQASDVWRFPRVHFWGDDQSVLITDALYPDWQIRLSTREKAKGRPAVPHSMPPSGIGMPAPVVLEHHKFLVKTRSEREAVAARYDAVADGLGTGRTFKVFSLPEAVYEGLDVRLVSYADAGCNILGHANWQPTWERRVRL